MKEYEEVILVLMRFDEIGYWSELKLEIVQRYAKEYSRILKAQARLSHVYIDGFSGPGVHVSKSTGEFIPGSPMNALLIDPGFDEYFLVDLDGDKVNHLRELVGDKPHVHVLQGDCNRVLLEEVFSKVLWEDYRRGLCLLDPYGLQLDWEVIEKAGKMRTIDLFLNFPICDMNRNVLWRAQDGASQRNRDRMTRYWCDESWSRAAYQPSVQLSLFGEPSLEKQGNEAVAEAFRERLKSVAGFKHVQTPLPMRNTQGAVVYYLFFASQNDTGSKIVRHIFEKFGSRNC